MERIGPYRIVSEVGRGGGGRVLRGLDSRTQQEVAIKVLLTTGVAPVTLRRFQREAAALAKVAHPHVVRLLDHGAEGGRPYLVLPFYSAGSLEDRITTGGPLSPEEAQRLGIQIAGGLAAAHAQGVLHRDLKPANVLLTEGGDAVLTDFGLVRDMTRVGVTERLTATGTFQGTPGFWAPEQASGGLDMIGPRTDVYGLGALLYAALSGQAPILGGSFIEVLERTVSEAPVPLSSLRPEVPIRLSNVVQRCLEKRAEDRWESAEALGEALEFDLFAREESKGLAWLGMACAGALLAGAVGALFVRPPGQDSAQADSAATQSASASQASPSEAVDPERLLAEARVLLRRGESEEAAGLLERAAGLGSPGAMLELSELHDRGLGVEANPVLALEWLNRAAEAGHPEGMHRLALRLRQRRGGVAGIASALVLFRRAAERGHLAAMLELEICYEKGIGVERDVDQALRWVSRAAEGGHPFAMTRLGLRYAQGLGVAKDVAIGRRWFEKAAAANEPEACFSLGTMHASGDGVEKNASKAFEWYRRAAAAGSAKGMYNLANCYLAGSGVERDPELALEWYRAAAEAGLPRAMINLATLLERRGSAAEEAEALSWYRRAAAAGSDEGMLRVGLRLSQGSGAQKDLAGAFEWYRRAAEAGNSVAMFNLGVCYFKGEGTEVNRDRSRHWLTRVLDSGNATLRERAERVLRGMDSPR